MISHSREDALLVRQTEREARRAKLEAKDDQYDTLDSILSEELVDRFVTAMERIADALERGPQQPLDWRDIRVGAGAEVKDGG